MASPSSMDLYVNMTNSEGIASEGFESTANISEWPGPGLMYYIISYIILDYVLWFSVVITEILFLIAFWRCKKLHTRLNYYMSILAVIKLFNLLGTLLFQVIVVFVIKSITLYYYCIERALDRGLMSLYLISVFILMSDWFLSNWIPQKMQFLQKKWFIIIASIFLIFLFIIFVQILDCIKNNRDVLTHLSFGIFIIVLIVLTIINLTKNRLIDNSRPTYPIVVANIIIYSLFVYEIIFHFSAVLFIHHKFFYMILSYLEILAFAVELGHPILVVYYLATREKYFKMAFDVLLWRRCRKYDQDELDEESVSEKDTNAENGDKV